jgi:hypothetical protein
MVTCISLTLCRKVAPLGRLPDEVSHGHRNDTLVSFYKSEALGCLEHID